METVIHNIRDLSGNERSAAEQLVGHTLQENQQLVIQIVTLEISTTQSGSAAREGNLPEWCNVYEGLTDDEIADIERSIVRDCGSRLFD